MKALTLRFADPNVQFALTVDEATTQLALFELLRLRFHATSVRARGVSWRMLHKVKQVEGEEKRLAAFPVIDGFAWPPIQSPPPGGPPATGEGLWSVRLDGVEADVRELWMLEYRYVGAGHVVGAFELQPMKMVWVGPVSLTLQPGVLSVGPAVAARDFALTLECTIAPAEIRASPTPVLRQLSASVKLQAHLEDLSAAELYVAGLEASGSGTLTADLEVTKGQLVPGSRLEARLPELRLRSGGAGFSGTVNATFALAADATDHPAPVGHAAAAGAVTVPLSSETHVVAVVSGAVADLALTSPDLSEGLTLRWLHARLGEARCEDASAVTAAAERKAPLFASAVLGRGPLVVSGTAEVTPATTVVRLERLSLGQATFAGAAISGGAGWKGAAAGRVAVVPVGLQLKGGGLAVVPLASDAWLAATLRALGIEPAVAIR